MLRIAILSDDETVRRSLAGMLLDLGYLVITPKLQDWRSGDSIGEIPDLVLLHRAAAGEGAAACRELKRLRPLAEVPIIAVLPEQEAGNVDFASGVDDFLLSPDNHTEVELRVKLALWRANKVDSRDTVKAGDLVINLANYQVTAYGKPVELTYKEYELLKFLVTRRGRVFTREALLDRVWGMQYFGGTRTVDVHIRRVRAKLGPKLGGMVETVRNVGYRFRA